MNLDIQYIDGTKIEAAANKYTFVWRGSVEKNKVKLEEKLKSVIQDIEAQTHEDDMEIVRDELPQAIDSKLVKEKLSQLNARLKESDKNKKTAE